MAQVITWVLVVGGWIYTNHTQNKRETRKELRTAIDKINNEVGELIKLGHDYWLTSPGDSQTTAREINTRFMRLSATTQHVTKRNDLNACALDQKMIIFMDRLTGDDFQSAQRTPLQPNAQKLDEISAAGMAVQAQLEQLFNDTHPAA